MVTGPGSFGSMLATHPDVDKVGFTGSTEVKDISLLNVHAVDTVWSKKR